MLSVREKLLVFEGLRSDQGWHDLHFSGSPSLGSLNPWGLSASAMRILCLQLLVHSLGNMGAKRIRLRQLVAPHFAWLIPVQAGTPEKIKRLAMRN
jgi:hypothetical protein